MGKESYDLFGLDEFATDEELEKRYEELKAKYNEEKWQDGEAGQNAARMLGKLEAAYEEIKEERKSGGSGGAGGFDDVGAAIRSGDLARAQNLLDAFNERSAEWHYLQSVVFYKKSWMNESKKQLEIALQMEPGNQKYRTAYDKLKARTEYTDKTGGARTTNPDPAQDPGDGQMGGGFCQSCASFCYTFLCVNCLFNLCCNCR